MVMPTFTCPDGLAVAYQTSGQGAPLLLLSGKGNGMGWWDPIVADFESDHLVIRFDYLGTGGSDAPASGYSLGRFADDVAALLDHLGIQVADVEASLAFSLRTFAPLGLRECMATRSGTAGRSRCRAATASRTSG